MERVRSRIAAPAAIMEPGRVKAFSQRRARLMAKMVRDSKRRRI